MKKDMKKLQGKTLADVDKSPAVLFYSKDFFTDTIFWTPQQVGYYIRLLCVQHLKHDHLLEEEILQIMPTLDPTIMEKFIRDKNGKYYNLRMEIEVLKRGLWKESKQPGLDAIEEARQRAREEKGESPSGSAEKHTDIEKPERFKAPTPEEVQQYCDERGNGISGIAFVAFYASKGWKVGKNKMKDWKQAVITWEQKDLKEKKLLMTKTISGTHPGQKMYTGSVERKF